MYEDISLITAIITPFTDENTIDYQALDSLTERLIAEGTQGFVIGGTTGESPTLTHDEKISMVKFISCFADDQPGVRCLLEPCGGRCARRDCDRS